MDYHILKAQLHMQQPRCSRPNCHNNLRRRWVKTLSGYACRSMGCAGHSREWLPLTGVQAGTSAPNTLQSQWWQVCVDKTLATPTLSSLSDDRYVLIRPGHPDTLQSQWWQVCVDKTLATPTLSSLSDDRYVLIRPWPLPGFSWGLELRL